VVDWARGPMRRIPLASFTREWSSGSESRGRFWLRVGKAEEAIEKKKKTRGTRFGAAFLWNNTSKRHSTLRQKRV